MPNNTVSDWSTTAASNTEVGGVDLAENSMRPRDVNNAIRTMMAQIASGILAWPTTTIELGHATDTTLSRGAAGFMAVEGKRVPSPASQAAGDIVYRGATEWERLAKGTAYQVLRQNTALTAPEWATAREVLTANRTYYVRTDGSDSNTGLVDSAGGAFLTIAKAISVVADAIDLDGFTVVIQLKDATWTTAVSVTKPWVGGAADAVILRGNASTPGNVVISTTSASAITCTGVGVGIRIEHLDVTTTTSGYGVVADSGARVVFGAGVRFGAVVNVHIFARKGAVVTAVANYSIIGGGAQHIYIDTNATLIAQSLTITLTGTPAFSTFFVSDAGAMAVYNNHTFSGSATGSRYAVTLNAAIQTFGGGATYLPGNAVGSTATGGQYA